VIAGFAADSNAAEMAALWSHRDSTPLRANSADASEPLRPRCAGVGSVRSDVADARILGEAVLLVFVIAADEVELIVASVR
jgi:hypothetical protein